MVPNNWEIITFGEVADPDIDYSFTGGPFGSDLKSTSYTPSGIRIIQLQNIGDGEFINDHKLFTSEEKADELIKCNIYPGEIIIAKMADPLARACIIPDFDKRYLMASDGIRLAIDEKKFDKLFVLYTINSKLFRNQALARGTGSTRLRIGLTELRNLPFPIPPLSEQQKIALIMKSVHKKIELINIQERNINLLKKSLRENLISGYRTKLCSMNSIP
jgi:type I restriction enzyme S subunit